MVRISEINRGGETQYEVIRNHTEGPLSVERERLNTLIESLCEARRHRCVRGVHDWTSFMTGYRVVLLFTGAESSFICCQSCDRSS